MQWEDAMGITYMRFSDSFYHVACATMNDSLLVLYFAL